MEEDDEFGDLYTDVLRPLATSVQSQPGDVDVPTSLHSRPIDPDVDSDDEEILYGAADLKNSSPNFNFEPGIKLNPSIQEKTLTGPRARSKFGGLDLNLDPNSSSKALRIAGGDDLQLEVTVLEKGEGVDLLEKGSDGGLNFMKEDDDLNIIAEERENKDDYLVEKDADCVDKQENMYSSAEQKENTDNYTAQGAAGKIGSEHMIPGLSAKFEDHGGSNLENDWDSDESEDDLQIVLNDNKHGPIGMESIPGMDDEDDEDGDQLVIVADNGDVGHHQQPVVEEQEWKGEEVGPGVDGERKELGDAAKASGVQPKIGYSNHMYHHSFHSQFKYVRPGAAPLPGVVHATPGGVQGHLRPLITMGPGAGRGRGDWRPRGTVPLQKGLHPGYGMPVWGHNAAGRGYGSGFDFTLPSHKTIFEVDIDGFEEKSWKLPGIDISDFFNFGLNEESWKDYCKQLEQLRLETTMQSKIRVYESGRTEQDYDPDLPAELAAAVNNQHIPPENANAGMAEAGPSDLARASAHVPSPAPIGRSIPVETGSGDRLPSIDTRRPRMHDSDAIIEIVCHNSNDDDMADQEDNDLSGEDLGRIDDIDDLQRDNAEFVNCFSHAYNGRKGGNVAGGEQLVSRDEIGGEGDPNEERYTKRRGQAKSFETYASDDGGKQVADDQNESSDIKDGKQNPPLSPSCAIASDREQAFGDDVNGESVMGDRSFDMDKEDMAVDVTTSDPLEDGKLRRPENKKIVGSLVEQVSRENSSENGISRSRSSKDHRKPHSGFEDEVLQYRHRPSSGRKSHHERDETGRHHTMGKGRENSYSQKVGAQHMKIENADWRKRTRVEDSRKREHGGEIGFRNRSKVRESERSGRDEHHQSRSQMDNDGSWMVTDHDHDNMKSRTEKLDDVRDKRRNGGGHISREHAGKEELTYNHSGSSSRRKRERDDIHAKLKDDDMHCVRKKEDGSRQKERGERQAHSKQSHEDILYRREREETRPPVTRSKRPTENKKWNSHSRGKDDYKGSGREYHSKNVGRHSDQLKRRDRVEDDSFSQNKGLEDANAHGNEGSNDEKRGTCERPGTSDGRDVYASDNSRLYEHNKQKEGRKGREFESGEHSSLTPSKRNQDEQSGRICETANSRDKTKQANVEEHGEEAPSDEQQTGSRRGHSKMERWTSHLERDLNITSISSPKKRQLDTTYNISGVSLSSKNVEPSVNDKDAGGETNNVTVKVTEDKHMDTVEKLKKRSERFKLPMPSEKEVMAIKKIESEPLSSAQTEHRPDSEIKPERPARKRRWTGN